MRVQPIGHGLALRLIAAALSASILLTACDSDKSGATSTTAVENQSGRFSTPAPPTIVSERWLTPRNERDNIDSVAVWTDGAQRHWLLATAKESDVIIIYDAATGARLGDSGASGTAAGHFRRPNGIFVMDDHVWVVERDNQRLQVLSLPDFKPVGMFGANVLTRPYGLWIHRQDVGYRVFITDSNETDDGGVPDNHQLDRRLHRFDIVHRDGRLQLAGHAIVGPVEGDGRLLKVESLWGDPDNDLLLVADEHESRRNLKQFDLDGVFTGKTLLDGTLLYEPEGIALQACSGGNGYWIVTDQDHKDNRFLVLDRHELAVAGIFTGSQTSNTDGVWLHLEPLPGFPSGAFYAVHDDGNVGAFDWEEILAALSLEACDEAIAH